MPHGPEVSAAPVAAVHLHYRPDIDGLRAFAVLSVVAFHAFPQILPGGFVGVDVFFVISGFLISSIVMSKLEAGRFSLGDFYERRVRRILPALIIVMFASGLFGWCALFADEYRQLGKHIAGGATFISNFLLWNESGYFDASAETKPLLHLWSLAIEEQFYLLWPLALSLVWTRRRGLMAATVAVAVVSLAANLWLTASDPTAGFYSPLTRFWELMAGAMLAYWTLHGWGVNAQQRNAAGLIGLLMVLAAVVALNRGLPYPGWRALLPTLGACALIAAGPSAWVNRRLLANRWMVGVGLISYPLYLWHWPSISFLRIIFNGTVPPAVLVGAMGLCGMLSWLTYTYVEKPIRAGHGAIAAIALAGLLAVAGVLGALIYAQWGFPQREMVSRNLSVLDGFDGPYQQWLLRDCRIVDQQQARMFGHCERDSRQTERYALLGDSKAGSLIGGLVRTSTPDGRWLFIGGAGKHGSPVPVLSEAGIYREFQPLIRVATAALAANPHVESIALVTAIRALFRLKTDDSIDDLPQSPNYAAALEGLGNVARLLTDSGKKVVLVSDNPTLPDPRQCLGRTTSQAWLNRALSLGRPNPRCELSLAHHEKLTAIYRSLLDAVAATNPAMISVFSTTPYLCDTDKGLCAALEGKRPLYSHTDHISGYAATKIGRGLNQFLARHAEQAEAQRRAAMAADR